MGPFNLNVFLIFGLQILITGSLASVIKLEKGKYNGIIIGIDGEKVSSTNCKAILENLNVLLPLFSGKLHEATEQKATIGNINVLLPHNWTETDCNLTAADIQDANPIESFRNSHFQITQNHSLADILPWTRQYRPCGQPGDSIVIPTTFLDNPNITDIIKAQIILHEWAKFRYGVFDEFGYEQEEHQLFPPCYTFDKMAHFTSCSSPVLPAVNQNASVCSLEYLSKYSADLTKKLGEGTTSVMSFPYIQNFTKFCNATSHNRWAPTKQNLYCGRKSVGEVVFSHSDFVQNNQDPDPVLPPKPNIGYLRHQHSKEYNPAYVIVIENSQDMRDQYKILHVKQAMAQFLEILEDNTRVHLIIFEGDTIAQYSRTLKGDEDREGLLKEIPEPDMNTGDPQNHLGRSLSQVIDKLLEIFNGEQSNSSHVLLFADSSPVNGPINDYSRDIAVFGATPHTISIFTFENTTESNSQEWLQWYSIPNTRNVVALPICLLPSPPGGPCSFQTSSFILDQIIGNFNDLQFNLNRPRFIQTWGQVSIPNVAGERTFNLEGDPGMVKRLYFFMTLPTLIIEDNPINYVQIQGIDGSCNTTNLLSYGHVIKFTGIGCTFKSGQWTLKVMKQVPPGSRPLLLNIFVEMNDIYMPHRLIVTPSLGTVPPNTQELLPNSNIYPVYVSLQTQRGHPVLGAQVTLHIFHPNLFTSGNAQDKVNGSVILLRDDGSSNGPDQTGNDGIYSGYLSGFSGVSKTFHLAQIQVTTTHNTLIMESSIPSKAVLLNDKLTNKCCGKMIHELGYSSFQPSNLKFQVLHFGFKTKEIWNSKLLFPPGPIDKIEVVGDDENTFQVKFDAVAGDNTGNDTITVTGYQACCVPSNSTESMESTPYPGESSCKVNSVSCDIRPPNQKQSCSMNKANLVKLWVTVEDQKLVDRLMCALRAINSNGEFGSLSQASVEISVTQAIDKLMGGEELKCDNLFDDKCLPFWVFWVLIGCLAGVLLVLVVVVCCWCCALRKKRKETTSTVESGKHPPKPTKENVLAVHYSPHPQQQRQFKNSRNNQSSVEDVNGEDESKVVKEIFVNHAYIQDGDGEIKIIADNGQILRKPRNDNSTPLPPIDENPNMQVFKPVPMPVSQKPSRMPRMSDHARSRGRRGHIDRPQIVHSNPMLRSDSSYNSLERQQQPPPQFIPSTRNTDPALVYATISRTGRLNNQQNVSTSPKQLTFDPHYMVPHNSVPLPPQPSSRQLAREVTLSRSPPKVPNYPPPISDSETSTDFDMRRRGGGGARRLPPQFTKPPPYPEGSQLVAVTGGQQTPASNDTMFRRGMPVQSRPVNPPVPPPRFDRQTAPANVRTRNNGSIKTFSSKQEMVSSDEDDSDEWDDGDNYEFQNTTGVSYA